MISVGLLSTFWFNFLCFFIGSWDAEANLEASITSAPSVSSSSAFLFLLSPASKSAFHCSLSASATYRWRYLKGGCAGRLRGGRFLSTRGREDRFRSATGLATISRSVRDGFLRARM